MVKWFTKLAVLVKKGGGNVHFEWPRYCQGWDQKEIRDFMKSLEFHECLLDGCRFGVVNAVGEPIKKPWKILTTSSGVYKKLHGHFCLGQHKHGVATGKSLENTGYYTKPLARKILEGIRQDGAERQLTWSEAAHMLFEMENQISSEEKLALVQHQAEDHSELTEAELRIWNDVPKAEQERLMREAMKIHCNTSHRPPRILAKSLKLAGAKDTAVIAMKRVKCDACKETGHIPPRPVAAAHDPASRLPWEIIGIDCKEVTDLENKEKTNYLVIIDEVTKLTRFVEVYTIDPKQHRNAIEEEILRAY